MRLRGFGARGFLGCGGWGGWRWDGWGGVRGGRLDVALVCTAFPETLRARLEGGGRWERQNIPIGIMQQSSWISFHGAEGK